jgi:hypothetical protein
MNLYEDQFTVTLVRIPVRIECSTKFSSSRELSSTTLSQIQSDTDPSSWQSSCFLFHICSDMGLKCPCIKRHEGQSFSASQPNNKYIQMASRSLVAYHVFIVMNCTHVYPLKADQRVETENTCTRTHTGTHTQAHALFL